MEAGASGSCSAPTTPGTQDRGTGLTAVAVQEGDSDVVEVRLANGTGALQVLLNQEVLSLAEQSWVDLRGEWDDQARSAGCLCPSSCPAGPPHLAPARAGGRGWCPGHRCRGGGLLGLMQGGSPTPLHSTTEGPALGTHAPGPRLSVAWSGPPSIDVQPRGPGLILRLHTHGAQTQPGLNPKMPGQQDKASALPRGDRGCRERPPHCREEAALRIQEWPLPDRTPSRLRAEQ